MRKRETREKVAVERAKTSAIKEPHQRSWKYYFAGAPAIPADFPKRIRDKPPEKVDPF
jgi:virulence-associated protein VagC